MKTSMVRLLLLGLLSSITPALHAQSGGAFGLEWSKIAGGGGTSTGGGFAGSGTIGQADAGAALTGGTYSLRGGFWSIAVAVLSPGAPLLTVIQKANGSVTVSWPAPSTGFVLQYSPDLGSAHWLDAADRVAEDGITCSITITTPAGRRFFRLQSNP